MKHFGNCKGIAEIKSGYWYSFTIPAFSCLHQDCCTSADHFLFSPFRCLPGPFIPLSNLTPYLLLVFQPPVHHLFGIYPKLGGKALQGINREVVLAEMPFSDTILTIVREWIGGGRSRFGETH